LMHEYLQFIRQNRQFMPCSTIDTVFFRSLAHCDQA
jgi:hypothetical protein